MHELSPVAQTLLWVLVGFIIALNLSLVFALLKRGRGQQPPGQTRHLRRPWESKDSEASAELARRVASLRQDSSQPTDPKDHPNP